MNTATILKSIFILLFVLSATAIASEEVLADKVLIEKKARRLTLYSKGHTIRVYKVALGRNSKGTKEREGDNKTPEGTYAIDSRNKKSGYHVALHVSYPNENDKKRSDQLGVSPGGNIMIHGIRNGFGQHYDSWYKKWIRVDRQFSYMARLDEGLYCRYGQGNRGN